MNILDKIIQHKKEELKKLKKISLKELLKSLRIQGKTRGFKKAISKHNKLCIIAEIKKKSPSVGVLRRDFNPVKLAQEFEKVGIQALSVLTDKFFFGGDISFISKIKEIVKLPILRKDFIIDGYQVYESYIAGADAILLIARIVSQEKLKTLYSLATKLGMDCLVEVYSKADLKKALEINPQIIGINNRNLEDFKVNLNNTAKLIRSIPKDKIVVSESGINSKEDLEFLKSKGVDAVLIGEAFMKNRVFLG